jgi:hypothetical protein
VRDLAWIKSSNQEAVDKYKAAEAEEDAQVIVHERMKKTARQISNLWRYIVIDADGNTQKNPLMAQDDLFRMFPEVAPNFFGNFGVVELVIRQKNGTQLILKRVR